MKILIVDDIKGWREFNSSIMHKIFDDDVKIDTAESATEAYNKILENNKTPYDIVITDLQMEEDYVPKYAGEWLVEQIKTLPSYYKTKIIMISATSNIRQIASALNVYCIPKGTARVSLEAYKEIL